MQEHYHSLSLDLLYRMDVEGTAAQAVEPRLSGGLVGNMVLVKGGGQRG